MFYLVSDLHCDNRNQYSDTLPDGTNSRLQQTLDFMRRLGDPADPARDSLFVAGDIFHNRRSVPHTVLERVIKLFRDLRGHFKNVIVVQGNHDETDTGDGSSALSAIEPHVTLLARPPGAVHVLDGVSVNLVPWTEDAAEAVSWCKREADYLVAHLGILGGLTGPASYEVPGKVQAGDLGLGRYRAAFFGHYHKHQPVGANACYIGSPMQQDWGEAGEEKGHIRLLPKKGAWTFIPNRESPRFVSVRSSDDVQALARPRDFVRWVATPEEAGETAERIASMQTLLGYGHVSLQVEPGPVRAPRLDVAGKPDRDVIRAFAEAHPPGEEALGAATLEEFVSAGAELLGKARAL